METDIVAGIEAGMRTVLVLTGSTDRATAKSFPFRPTQIVDSIADLVDQVE
jgi:NagD protein